MDDAPVLRRSFLTPAVVETLVKAVLEDINEFNFNQKQRMGSDDFPKYGTDAELSQAIKEVLLDSQALNHAALLDNGKVDYTAITHVRNPNIMFQNLFKRHPSYQGHKEVARFLYIFLITQRDVMNRHEHNRRGAFYGLFTVAGFKKLLVALKLAGDDAISVSAAQSADGRAPGSASGGPADGGPAAARRPRRS